jgi:hypothetical protein
MIYLRKDVILFKKKLTMFRIHIKNEMIEKNIYIYQFFNIALLSSWIIILEIHSNDLIFIISTSFIFDNLILSVSTTHIYYSSIIMCFYNCSYYDSTNKINRELKRHLMTCEIRLSSERRKIFKKVITISKNINVDNARNYFMIDDI